MNTKYHYKFKTLGPRAAQLITELNERHRSTFTVADVESITGLSAPSARNLVHKAHLRGLVTRLKPGLFNLVPFELGRATEHVGSPYLIAQELAGSAFYCLSHGTAFELNRMVTQPNLNIYVSCKKRMPPQTVGGYKFQFIRLSSNEEFGITKHWIDKEHFVMITDIERTIIDGLRHPPFAGGITEVAKGLWMKRNDINIERLLDYASRFDVGAVVRRLGFLLEQYQMATKSELASLRAKLTPTYQRLDPMLPGDGPYYARWRLQLNVDREELDAVRLG